MPVPANAPFTVIILSSDQDAREYDKWAATCAVRPIIVAEKGGDITYEELNPEYLRRRFLAMLDNLTPGIDASSIAEARDFLKAWVEVPTKEIGYRVGGHNTITPNIMVLASIGYFNVVDREFNDVERGIAPYIDQIIKTTRSILDIRHANGESDMHRILRPSIDLNLFAPAIYPDFFETSVPDVSTEERKRFTLVREALQRQTGYNFWSASEGAKRALSNLDLKTGEPMKDRPPHLHFLAEMRRNDLNIGTDAVAALAVSEFSPVMRLPNDVNRTAGLVRKFAEQYRARTISPRKRMLAFREVQERMKVAVPAEFLEFVRSAEIGVRVIADAHLEWLDVDGIPLGIRKDLARVPVTPGNLFIDQVGMKEKIMLTPEGLQHVLVISALKRQDPISRMFDIAFGAFSEHWKEKLKIEYVEVSNVDEFVDAVNAFDGNVFVFDGHGAHRDNEAATLYLQSQPVDVWKLRGRIARMPPIVLLSACDTHAADRNHATVGNGFLALGARAVLASVFPLYAPTAATFIARLLYRISAYVEVAIGLNNRALTWLEIVSGMIRMQLRSDFDRALLKSNLISKEVFLDVGSRGNRAINGGSIDPFAEILQNYQDVGVSKQDLMRVIEMTIANSSAISYIHLGRPETISIDLSERIDHQLKYIIQKN